MVPAAQVVQAVAEQAVHPEPQDTQLPLLESRKKPVSHAAHAVPLGALVHPVVQVQVPAELQEPFKQLHLEGAVDGSGVERHAPVPDGPSSHLSQLLGHLEQLGPKKPGWQSSQDGPVNPAGHTHLPWVEQVALEEQAGEHVLDWISLMEMDEAMARDGGSWDQNGKLSQITTREVDEPVVASIAAQVLGAMRKEPRPSAVALNVLGLVGWEINLGWPMKPSVGYDNTPGWRTRERGREGVAGAEAAVVLVKPFPMDTVDEDEVRAFCKFESETEDVYVPGSKMKSVSLVDNVAPKMVIFVVPWRHWLVVHTSTDLL
jgi:hypothetical protein